MLASLVFEGGRALSGNEPSTPPAPPGLHEETLSSDSLWFLGCLLEFFGTLASVAGKQLFRYAAVSGQKGAYVYGILLVVLIYPAANIGALEFAAQTVISTVTGMVVVWNILLAPCTLGEDMTTKRMTSAVIIMLGIVGAGSFGAHYEVDRTPDSELAQLGRPASIVYYIILGLTISVGYFIVLKNEKWMPPGSVRQGALQGETMDTISVLNAAATNGGGCITAMASGSSPPPECISTHTLKLPLPAYQGSLPGCSTGTLSFSRRLSSSSGSTNGIRS